MSLNKITPQSPKENRVDTYGAKFLQLIKGSFTHPISEADFALS
jgi:hypothetical protein